MKIRFLGAARTVTGSCYQLIHENMQILVDCGMYQGRHGDEINGMPFQFNPADINCVLLTHAHIDHSGLLPRLVAQGFRGPILTTPATADLCEIMLLDSAVIQEKDAEWLMKKALRAGKNVTYEPLYTQEDVKAVIPRFQGKAYGQIESLGQGLEFRFVDAGHILGSGSLEVWYPTAEGKKKIVFSGDIGKSENPIIKDPEHVSEADYVLVESTYGNRFHKDLDKSIDELVEAITGTFKRGGNVLIPSFAVGRTQDILYTLNRLTKEGKLPPMDVFVDSPLAERATAIYASHPELYDADAMAFLRAGTGGKMRLHFTSSVEESQAINKIKSGAIIMAGSGMCEGGRIRHHFKHNLWRPECSIVFVGYQAHGTLGRAIVDGVKRVHVLGEEIAVRARVFTIGGFSAHADQKELLEWLGAFRNRPEIFIVHGEEEVALEFEKVVRSLLGLTTRIPYKGEEFTI
jgi:metallo-beta-lactamase family protein